MDHFFLYEIGKVPSYHPAYFLSGASASGIFFTDPAQPIRDVLPSALHTAKAAAKSNVIRTRPERLECRRSSLYELLFRSLKLRDERRPFRIVYFTRHANSSWFEIA
jgi:hypothetical protein